MKETTEQSDKSRDLPCLLILLTVALCIGIYLIATTAIIAKDGVTFIKYAKHLESAPIKTMMNEFQHPGYPWLILMAYRMTGFLHENTSILSWIYCGQSVALIFRLLTLIVLYFIAKQLFGDRWSLWAVLILILLPKPAEYGSDALSDWPHLFFLVTGLLVLLKGALDKKWWLFGFAGLAAGAGYLIRPECAQLVLLGSLWLGLQLFWSKRSISKDKVLFALALQLVGFLAIAGPYMKLKGAVFPKKDVGQFAQSSRQQKTLEENEQSALKATHTVQFTSSNMIKASEKLFENIGETLMWFFMPALFIGMYKWFKRRKWGEPETFFLISIIVLNVFVMIWLHCKYGYMSDRHTLPLLILPILYIPVGLQELAIWCHKSFCRKVESRTVINCNERFWFLVLFFIGVSICTPKLLRPIRIKKQGYRAAANWLVSNTRKNDIIAVPDKRISFYAMRKELEYDGGNVPADAVYIVTLLGNGHNQTVMENREVKVVYRYADKRSKKAGVVIYRRL